MKKRYQVFVSSTFIDLKDERQEVMQALLELNCIPAGMELFPAANDDQWTLIKKVIADSDYYMVVLAGRYGSVGPDGYSYTEMEYRYALELGKPVMGFVHGDPGSIVSRWVEPSAEGKEKLASFQELVQKKHCKFWESPSDLGGKVSRSLIKLINDSPAIGWVRGDQVPDESATEEILSLRRRIEELESEKKASRLTEPQEARDLAKGNEKYKFRYTLRTQHPTSLASTTHVLRYAMSWDEIFSIVSPILINEAPESQISGVIASKIRTNTYWIHKDEEKFKGLRLKEFEILDEDFHTIKVQFKALGYIRQSEKKRGIKDSETYWTLTPYGDTVMTRLRAIKSSDA